MSSVRWPPAAAQVDRVNSLYPGRASMSPLLDLLITLLHWGAAGWRSVLQQREELYTYARQQLQVGCGRARSVSLAGSTGLGAGGHAACKQGGAGLLRTGRQFIVAVRMYVHGCPCA